MRIKPVRLLYLVAILCILVVASKALTPTTDAWKQYASPQDAGFSSDQLEAIHHYADSIQSAAVMVIYKGHVLAAWGDVKRSFRAHSVRKSLVSALYGIGVDEGQINLETTLGELDISDNQELTNAERQAQLKDIIAARSGVYLPAAYAPEDQDRKRPQRGSYAPGTYWFYNNWDFNVAGVIYEQLTGEDLYDAFNEKVAQPIGMEDLEVGHGVRIYEPGLSIHPAHTFRISARDLARFGQLYLQKGQWNGSQVIPPDWITDSTRPISDFGDGQGYGYMWWTVEAGSYEERFPGRFPHLAGYDIYLGRGSGGQGVVVIPEVDLVFVHRGDTDNGRGVGGGSILTILDKILAAQEGKPDRNPALKDLEPVPFTSQLPEIETPEFITLKPSILEEYMGEYELGPEAAIRVFMFEGRPFMFVPGRGEAELFAVSETEFTIQVMSGVHISFDRDTEDGRVAVHVVMGEQEIRAVKRS